MRLFMKRMVWGVLALVGLGLALILAWLASNWRDADPQPWPEALTPRAGVVTEKDDFWSALMAAPHNSGATTRLTLGDCKSNDCSASWRADASRWTAMRQAHAALGAACETGTKRRSLQLVEPLPATFKPDIEVPRFQNLTGCSVWLLSLALEASAAGNIDLATAKVAQSARLSLAAREGSQSLIGHTIALTLVNWHLQALMHIAVQNPAAASDLQALPLPTTAQMGSAQRHWAVHEANVARSMIALLNNVQGCPDKSGLGNWYCRISADRWLPNYTEQLFSAHSQQVLASIRDDAPLNAVNAVQARLEDSPTGLFGSPWHWRGTISHILLDVAHPAYRGYLARSANTLLAAQTTELWLQVRSQTPAARATWLALQIKDTPLANRLTVPNKGDWQLQLFDASYSPRVPTRWPAWPVWPDTIPSAWFYGAIVNE